MEEIMKTFQVDTKEEYEIIASVSLKLHWLNPAKTAIDQSVRNALQIKLDYAAYQIQQEIENKIK